MEEELISIIIPVYNVEKYLRKCLNSIIDQTYKNLEIILIDDCSSDNSFKICKEFGEKDKRIKVYKNKKNLGSATTRNIGLDHSKGKYIGFVDSDDWLDKNFYKTLYTNAKKNDVLISGCATSGYFSPERIEHNHSEIKSGIIDGKQLILDILGFKKRRWGTFWNKIFHESLKSDLYAIDGFGLEDYYVIINIFTKYNSIYFDNKPLYFYRERTDSQSKKVFRTTMFSEKDISKKIKETLDRRQDSKEFNKAWDYFDFNIRYSIIVAMFKNPDLTTRDSFESELQELKKASKDYHLPVTKDLIEKRAKLIIVKLLKNSRSFKAANVKG